MRDLITLYNAKGYVNASLSLISSSGAKTLTNTYYYWSSTEYDNLNAWKFNMYDGERLLYTKYSFGNVRPVLVF